MRIQHNIMAMSSYRNYTNNVGAMKKNLEKLSSGYKINRAGDDAAGLAISEKMRAQITGLKQAQNNAKSGINLVQTAEGALQEVQDMLNRMVKLAEQSANGTYDEKVDRNQLQKEFQKLTDEIDRINKSANFNGIALFGGPDGTGAGGPVDGGDGATEALAITAKWNDTDVTGTDAQAVTAEAAKYSFKAVVFSDTKDEKVTIAGVEMSIGSGSGDIDVADADDAEKTATAIVGLLNGDDTFSAKYTASVDTTDKEKVVITAKKAGADTAPTISVTAKSGQTATTVGNVTTDTTGKDAVPAHKEYNLSDTPKDGDTVTIDGKTYTFATGADGSDGATFENLAALKTAAAKNGVELVTDDDTAVYAVPKADDDDTAAASATPISSINLQIGDTSDDYNRLKVNTYDIGSKSLKDISEGTGKTLSQLKVNTEANAGDALSALKGMVNYISDIRGELGATQNRLDHTINNLSVMEENIQDAESTIRDTDIAEEMMAYTKNNILIQSAQAMLAQANQVPQGVLQLLQ